MKKSLAFIGCFLVASWATLSASTGVSTIDGGFKALAQSGSRIVAIDLSSDDSVLSTSDDDGASFTTREVTTENYEALAAVGSTVIAVGIDAQVLRSADSGTTWSQATAPVLGGSLYSVVGRTDGANPNQWLAVGDDGVSGGSVYRSIDDGSNWTVAATLSSLEMIKDVIWTGNRWLLCGRDFFDGLVYSSTDGVTWSASTVPAFTAPLLAMSHDGAGVVIAVGEAGAVLRSVDDGLTFTAVATDLFSGDLNAVIVDSSGTFYLGGDEKSVIALSGTNASFLIPPAAEASPILDFVLINDAPSAAGSFGAGPERTIPLDLLLTVGGTLDLRLTVSEALSDKSYFLETSIDLVQWSPLLETSQVGTDGPIFFDVSKDVPQRFWRVVEF